MFGVSVPQEMPCRPPDDRDYYRRMTGYDKKSDVGPGADSNFDFRGGFGRGRAYP